MPRRRRDGQPQQNPELEGQAEEDQDILQDAEAHEQSIHEGESQDLDDPQGKDYEAIEELDKYQQEGIDDQDVEDSQGARIRAEQALDRQGNNRVLIQGLPFMEMEMSQQRQDMGDYMEEQHDEEGLNKYLDLETAKGKLLDWIKQKPTIKFIKVYFAKFVRQYVVGGARIYLDSLNDMCAKNQQSLIIKIQHLLDFQPTLAYWLGNHPGHILPLLHQTLYAMACKQFRGYSTIHKQAFVRLKQMFVIDQLKKLRHDQLNKIVNLKGVVTFRSSILSQMRQAYFSCRKCGNQKGPFLISDLSEFNHGSCAQCQGKTFKVMVSKTTYRNYQTCIIQENPHSVQPGRVPRHKQAILYGDLADKVKPGDQVQLIGIYSFKFNFSLASSNNRPILSTFVECNNIYHRYDDFSHVNQRQIVELSKKQNLVQILIESCFPSIFGHRTTKLALLLALFGGVQVEAVDHRIRGDINVILVGDPGTAKSQMLKTIQSIAPKAMYTTGKGASAVGLTATVRMNHITKQWGIQAGALVMADKGVCIIDQFDKMTEYDRSAIHQAMQQQSISIAKAGLCTRLNARCSVVAAANPVKGRYDRAMTFRENVDLSEPILSRFDMLCVIQDEIDQVMDDKMSTFIINSHMRNHPVNSKLKKNGGEEGLKEYQDYMQENSLAEEKSSVPLYSKDFIRSYITYAREKFKPCLKESQKQSIGKFYVTLRKESAISGGMNIVVRHIQSMIRMAEAHAKLHLRQEVQDRDIEMAKGLMLQSFIQTQKPSIAKSLSKQFRRLVK